MLAGLAAAGLGLGACSMDIGSMFSKPLPESSDVTGSIPKQAADAMASAKLPPEPDLVLTRAAVNEVLSHGRPDASVPWENSKTGARGTVTAIASAYTVDNTPCRDFLASYVNGETQSWMRGEACRQESGKWEVRSLRPWIGS
jgi:surface antigen